MTGPQHYREAEETIAAAKKVQRGSPEDMSLMAEAQVHATLALAAPALGLDDSDNWTVTS